MEATTFLKEEDAEFQLVEGRPVSFPASPRALLGRAKGDEFESRCPCRTTSRTRSCGASRPATGHIKETKEEVLPELDDEFARQVGEGFASLEALRDAGRGRPARGAGARRPSTATTTRSSTCWPSAPSSSIPPVLVEREVERLLEDQAGACDAAPSKRRRAAGALPRARSASRGGDPAELRPMAERRVRRSLVLSEVAEAEHIDVTDEEVEAESNGSPPAPAPRRTSFAASSRTSARRIAEAVADNAKDAGAAGGDRLGRGRRPDAERPQAATAASRGARTEPAEA